MDALDRNHIPQGVLVSKGLDRWCNDEMNRYTDVQITTLGSRFG